MKRTKHSLSHYRLLTCDMGKLVPIACYPVLPGDSVQQSTSLLLRANPLAAPVMHPVSVRVHHWFVPNRLVWEDWEDFITGGSDGEGDGAVFPTIAVAGGGIGSLLEYLGVPTSMPVSSVVNALPFRAYALIWNEFYRDQDLQTAAPMAVSGGGDGVTDQTTVRSVAWEKDYQTTSRPWAQKGPEITLPLGDVANVITGAEHTTGAAASLRLRNDNNGAIPNSETLAAVAGEMVLHGVASSGIQGVYPTNLYADLAAATSVDVNTVRRAFALQRYQEARAMYGSRYTEYLRYLGVRSSDARLQRPEYLGGGKQTISFTEVLQTAPTTDGDPEGVGNLKGHGIAAMRSRRYRRFFEEHGYVISLLSVRPRTMYVEALNRDWFKTTKEDFWQRELELIGMQEVYNKEVYVGDTAPNDVFGYNDRYAEYRHIPSTVHGEFRDSTLNSWHLGRSFGSDVTLNSDFITCAPSDRIYQAPLANANLWIMAAHSIQARRMVGRAGRTGRIM